MDDAIKNALRLALRSYAADGGVPDETGQEEFLRKELEGSAPQYDPEGGMRTAKKLALDAYGLTDIGGLQEALGYMPKPEGGYEKSALQHAREGDYATAGLLAMGAVVPGAGKIGKLATKAADPVKDALRIAYERKINPTGLYSHAAEAAANLPQEKGSYEQMMAMLQRSGVKPEELHWSGAQQFAGQPVTREQLVQHFEQGVPKIEESILGGERPTFWNVSSAGIPGGGGGQQPFATRELAEQELARRQQEYPSAFHSISDLPTMESRPKFEQYTIPGGENYREVLMHMPSETAKLDARRREIEALGSNATGEQRAEWASIMNSLQPDDRDIEGIRRFRGPAAVNEYKSSHWDQPNVLAHLRLSDRTGPEGEKILHMEELQSDWGQEGRKKGFAQKLTPELQEQVNNIASKLDPRFVPPHARNSSGTGIDTENFLIRDINHWKETGAITPEDARVLTQYANIKSGLDLPPAGPYVASPEGKHTSSWVDLGLKRALREAVEGGYNKLVWTPGAEQAARYSLSRQVDSIAVPSVSEAGRSVRIDSKDGKSFRMMVNNEGVVDGHGSASQFTGKKLDEVVGKEMADKIMGINQPHEFSGEGLNVGGEGMKSFYDKIVPTQLQKIVKKLDPEAKVQMGGHAIQKDGEQIGAHVIEITPKMRESILRGLPAFASGGSVDEESQEKFLKEQLEGSAPQYVEEKDFPSRAARDVEAVDRALGRINDFAAKAMMMDAMRSPQGRSAAEILTAPIPPDPNEVAKQAIAQYEGGDKLGGFETLMAGMPQTGAIRAYHGSPYRFDRFDISKIGTGEGNQTFGHGLYFAESEPVARSYRDMNAHKGAIDLEHEANKLGIPLTRESRIELMRQAKANVDAAQAAKQLQWANVDARSMDPKKLAELIDRQRNSIQGSMYEVDIHANPEHLLDWDKPLSEQSNLVKNALYDTFKVKGYKGDYVPLSDVMKQYRESGLDPEKAAEPYFRSGAHGAYTDLGNQYGSQALASQVLKEVGIPGIKYLDAGSRGAGEGSRNYVIFDDKLIDILRRYANGGSVDHALRLARQMGGPAEEGTVERKPWSPFQGLKITPPPEKLSSEPDIREYQQKRHAFEFEGGAEPEAPKRKVVVDAPLLGGKKELGELPYDYAGMANTVLNTLYGLKTAPLYASPYTAPVGRALDAYETVKKVGEDPSAFSSYTALPKLVRGAGPIGAVGAGAGAVMAQDKDEEEPIEKAFGGAAYGDQVNSLEAVYDPRQSPLDITDGVHTPALSMNGLTRDEDIQNALGLARSKMSNGGQPGAKTPEQEEAERQAAVTAAYNTYLGRAPEATGQAYWLNQLQSGAIGAPDLSQQFQQSAEGQVYASDLGRAFETAYGRAPREATEAMNWARAYREANPVNYTLDNRFLPSGPLPNWNPSIPTSNINTPPLNPTLTQTQNNPLQPFTPNIPISGLPTPGIGSDVVVPGATTGAGTGTATPGTGGSPVTPDNRNEIPVWNPNIGRSDMATPPIAPPLEQLRSNQVTVNPQDYSSFVTSLYNTYTGRAPDVEGQNFFLSKLEQGASPADVAQVFASSPEAQMNQVGSMYQYVLGRQPDAEGLNYFKDQIAQGRMDLADVAESLMQSPEYQDYMTQQFEAAQSGINEVNPFDFAATALQSVGERGPMPDGYRDPNVWGQSETPDLFPTSFASTLLNKGLGADQQLRPGYVDPNVMLASRDNAVNRFQFAVEALEGGLGENGVYKPYVDASINAQKVNDAIAKFNPDNPNSFASGVFRSLANREPTAEELASLSMMNDPLAKGLLSPKEAASEIGKMVSAPLPPARPSDAQLTPSTASPSILDRVQEVVGAVGDAARKTFTDPGAALGRVFEGIKNIPQGLASGLKGPVGDKVTSVGDKAASFLPGIINDLQEKGLALDKYFPGMFGWESGGKGLTARARTTTAAGLGQFLAGTYKQVFKELFPNSGLTDSQILALRTQTTPAAVAANLAVNLKFAQNNAKDMADNGIAPTPGSMYGFHLLGKGDGLKLFKAGPGAKVGSLGLGAGVISKNKGIFTRGENTTVQEAKENMEKALTGKVFVDRGQKLLTQIGDILGAPVLAGDTQQEQEQQEQESVTPPPSTGGGSGYLPGGAGISQGFIPGGDSGFVPGGGGTSGAADISGAGGDYTGGGAGIHTPHIGTGVHHTTPVTHGGVHHVTHTAPTHVSHDFGVSYGPDLGSHVIHSPSFSDYAGSHGFGHSTVGQHHGGSHSGTHNWSWDMLIGQNPYGNLPSYKDGGVVEDALQIAHKRLKGGKINTKIDTDPDWDMKLARGGRR